MPAARKPKPAKAPAAPVGDPATCPHCGRAAVILPHLSPTSRLPVPVLTCLARCEGQRAALAGAWPRKRTW